MIHYKKLKFFLAVICLTLLSFSCSNNKNTYQFLSSNQDLKIALVLSGTVNGSYWDKAAYQGLARFKADHGGEIVVVDRVGLKESQKVFSELAKKNFSLIIGNGYKYADSLKKVARIYPKTFFVIVGGEDAKSPNLSSFKFKDEQFGYLIGIVTGLNTATNKVGIVVGEKISFVERTILGMRKGLKAVNPKADLVVSYINSWDDIAKGKEAGVAQVNTGVDVIAHLAGKSGIGVIKAAEESDISIIGSVTDQHDLAPTSVIASVLQDVSQIVYLTCEHYFDKMLEPKVYRYGLKDQVIELTPSYGNIDPPIETRINRLKDKLADLETGN